MKPGMLLTCFMCAVIMTLTACGRSELPFGAAPPKGTIAAESDKTYCVHEITSVTPNRGTCNKWKVGDKLCINCSGGSCPSSTNFDTDDGTWLRACTISTQVSDRACKDIWESGTCKSYVTLEK